MSISLPMGLVGPVDVTHTLSVCLRVDSQWSRVAGSVSVECLVRTFFTYFPLRFETGGRSLPQSQPFAYYCTAPELHRSRSGHNTSVPDLICVTPDGSGWPSGSVNKCIYVCLAPLRPCLWTPLTRPAMAALRMPTVRGCRRGAWWR